MNDHLSNSIQMNVGRLGHIMVGLSEEISSNEESDSKKVSSHNKKQRIEETVLTTNGTIPDSVLQYERQLRKIQAQQKSVADLSIDEHLKIVYEDTDVIVVDKPSGVLCVPGINNKPNILQLVCQHLSSDNKSGTIVEAKSEMIAHRLDMDTSGLVIFCKTIIALKKLQSSFRDRRITMKEYHALLCGHLPIEWESGDIHLPLQRDHRHPPFMRIATPFSEVEAQAAVADLQTHGFQKLVKKKPKPSHTEFRILQREYIEYPTEEDDNPVGTNVSGEFGTSTTTTNAKIRIPVTRVALTPHTGRTHQLRVHCAAMGYPIVGDPAYGLYGEAHARGGVDRMMIVSSKEEEEDEDNDNGGSSLCVGASLELQESLNKYRPSHCNTMCLHAAKLGIDHPMSGIPMLWTAPTPF